MPEFRLDDDMNLVKAPMSKEDLSMWANFYQKKYFPNAAPAVTITVNTNDKFQGAACFDPTDMIIHVAERITPFENLAKIVLLHEMIHVNLHHGMGDGEEGDHHGEQFKTEIKRLMTAGAYDNLL